MAAGVTFERGHLLVAAIRVLRHRDNRSPDDAAIADCLGLPVEYVRTALAHLAERGVVRLVRTPFEARVELADHTLLEDLPRAADAPALEKEVQTFLGGRKERQHGLTQLFRSGELDEKSRQKQAGLEDRLKGFKPRTPGPFPEDDE